MEPFDQKRTLLGVDLDEVRLDVARREQREMLVDDLASERAVAVEVAHDVRALPSRLEERFLVGDLLVLSVAETQPLLLLFLEDLEE